MTSLDLATALLHADAAERERLLRDAPRAELEAAVGELGHRRDPAAAEVLVLVESVVEDRAVRKAARRELHRLRSMGVFVPETATAASQITEERAPEVHQTEAWASDFDPSGSRVVWLLGERRLGGAWFAALVLNDVNGLQEMSLIDTTRKRFQRDFEESRRKMGTFVSLPGDYALRLVREGVDLARERGTGVPTRYHALHDVFGEAPGPPERALVYETISPAEATFNPDWLEQSSALLSEQELAGWHVTVPSELRSRTLEAARAPFGGILVPGHTPEQQALQLVAEASSQTVTPVVRHAFKRRLEETAYVFVSTDRLLAARRAVAAAHALEDDRLPVERHPLMRLLVASGLARLLGGEVIGGRSAAEVLIDLVERAAQQSQASPVETRASGLILPR